MKGNGPSFLIEIKDINLVIFIFQLVFRMRIPGELLKKDLNLTIKRSHVMILLY